jgi:hypothetical protein
MSRLTQREQGRPASHDMWERRQNRHASATLERRGFLAGLVLLGPGEGREVEVEAEAAEAEASTPAAAMD